MHLCWFDKLYTKYQNINLIIIFRILIVLENRNIWMGDQYKTSCIKIYYIKLNFCSEMEWKYELKEKKNGVNNSLVMYFLKISI